MQHWIYGTVFNNVQTIEESIASVYSPDSNIAIVDAYSTDGTYEKLLALRKEFNLTLSRARCSRGKGRDIALRMCPVNSFAAYIDLDAVYNGNFRKILEEEIDRTLVWQHHSQTCYFSMVDTAIKKGGFRDLSVSETLEFILRCGIDRTLPVQVGRNMQYTQSGFGGRERRYATGKKALLRIPRISIDSTRGQGISYQEFINYYGYSRIPLYLAVLIKGKYRIEPRISNIELLLEKVVETMCDPRESGISDDWIALPIPYPLFSDNEKAEEKILQKWKEFHKYRRIGSVPKWGGPVLMDREFIVYTLTQKGLENYISADPYEALSMSDFLEIE